MGLSSRDIVAHYVAARIDSECPRYRRTGKVDRDVALIPKHESMNTRLGLDTDNLAGRVHVPR